jgi:outer membrane protein assembly factor BamB
MYNWRLIIPLILIGSLILTNAAYPADQDSFWPQFHGPNRDNISTEKGLLKKWPDNGPDLLWTTKDLGHGYSSISIADGMIYTAGSIEKDTVIIALNMEGKILWQVKNGKAWTGDHPGTRGTPTIDGDRLFHQSPHGNLICLDAKTGDRIWEFNIIEKFKSKIPRWALSESLLIDGNHLICCPGGPQTCIVALNKENGSVIWKAPSTGERAGYASPTLVEYKGLRIIIKLTSKGMIGVNADTGELLWHIKHESYADENVLMPVFHNGEVFISTLKTGSVKWKVNVKNGKVSLEEIWRTEEIDNHHGGVILLNGNLYGTSTFRNRNLLVCLDWKTGRNKYMDKGVGKVSLTYADGMLYTLSIDGVMGLVRPTPEGHKLVSSFEIPKGGKGKSWAHPVVCGPRLYIRHGEFLYAYRLR